MRQLTLDVRPDWTPTLAEFVPGGNADLLQAIALHLEARNGTLLYLWGEMGSGRSHLLRAAVLECTARGRPARYLAAAEVAHASLREGECLAIDDVEALDAAAQAQLFRLLIGAAEAHVALLFAGGHAPQHLALREDVRTRIGQGLAFEIKPLSDADKERLLLQHASRRGMLVEADLVRYLLRHGRRDIGWLMSVLDALDEASLAHARRVTLPLLRDILREAPDQPVPSHE